MHSIPYHFLLFAQRSRLDHLSDSFKTHSNAAIDKGEVIAGLSILAGIAALVWLLSRFLTVQEHRKAYNSPLRLFLALCKAHELRWSDRWLLWRLARERRLKDPARIFLEPQLFEEAGLRRSLRAQAPRLRQLRNALFAEPPQSVADQHGPRPTETKDAAPPAAPLLRIPPGPTLDIPPWTTPMDAGSMPGTPTV
jgi:hypothetical protein